MTRKKVSDLIHIGVVIKDMENRGFRDHLLINTAGTTELTKLAKVIENVELARRNTQLAPMDASAMGSQDNSSKETVHGVEFTVIWRETVERKPNTCKTT